MHEEILKLATALAQPSPEEIPLLDALCTAAESDIAGRLRNDVSPKDCGDAFPCAAALLATAGLLPCRFNSSVEQFTAGEVSVRMGGGSCEAAAALRRQADEMMSPFWTDDRFAFWGVRG